MNTRTTSLTIDHRNFYAIPEDSLGLGAIEIEDGLYMFDPACLETAKRAAGSPSVASLRSDKGEVREATDLEIAYLRGVGMEQIQARHCGGFDILPATDPDAFRE